MWNPFTDAVLILLGYVQHGCRKVQVLVCFLWLCSSFNSDQVSVVRNLESSWWKVGHMNAMLSLSLFSPWPCCLSRLTRESTTKVNLEAMLRAWTKRMQRPLLTLRSWELPNRNLPPSILWARRFDCMGCWDSIHWRSARQLQCGHWSQMQNPLLNMNLNYSQPGTILFCSIWVRLTWYWTTQLSQEEKGYLKYKL